MMVKRSEAHFSKNSKVEVRSIEDGFKGAWFPAIIVDPQPSIFPEIKRRKSFNSSNKALVQYETLLADEDDGPPHKPLTELVDVGLIRPKPPAYNAGKSFEPGDFVDAFWNDGWWPGVLLKVHGDKYTVGFKTPPDLLELERSDLRLHFDFRDGSWVLPEKLSTIGSIYSHATPVEVNLNQENRWYAWLPATYLGQLGVNSFLLQYKSSNNCDVKVVVYDNQIRPQPPKLDGRDFCLFDTVDAFHDMGWWVGEVTKVLTGKRYVVNLKYTQQEKECSYSELRPHLKWTYGKWVPNSTDSELRSEPTSKRFRHSELATSLKSSGATKDNAKEKTPCSRISGKNQMEHLSPCTGNSPYGKTKKKLKISQLPNDDVTSKLSKKLKGGQSEDSLSLAQLFSRRTSVETLNKEAPVKVGVKTEKQVRELGRRKGKKGSEIETADEEDVRDEHVMDNMESYGIRSESEVTKGSHAAPSCLLSVEEVDQHNEDGVSGEVKRKGKRPALYVECSKDPATGYVNYISESSVLGRLDLTGEKNNGSGVAAQVEITETQVVKDKDNPTGTANQQKEDNGRRAESGVTDNPTGTANQPKEAKGRQAETGVTDNPARTANQQNEVKGRRVETGGTGSEDAVREAKTVESGISCWTEQAQVAVVTAKTFSDDTPFSLCTDEMHSIKAIEGSSITAGTINQQKKVRRTQVGSGVAGNIEHQESPGLPFMRSSPVWEKIESMDIFKRYPQKPHFHPLVTCRDSRREGTAVGYMVTFASTVEKTCKLQVGDPRDYFNSILEELDELETLGFDVQAVQHRVKSLLEMKAKMEQLQDQSKEVEIKLMEHTRDRAKHIETISRIEKEIKDLEEKCAMLTSMSLAKDSEISRLQAQVNLITKGIQTTHRDFEKLAAATL